MHIFGLTVFFKWCKQLYGMKNCKQLYGMKKTATSMSMSDQ